MDVESEFKLLRTKLQASTNALRGDTDGKNLKFGPCDIVSIEQGLERISKDQEKTRMRLRRDTNFSLKLTEFDSLPSAIRNLNTQSTPNPFDKTELLGTSILPILPTPPSATVSRDISLMVTNTSVVDDPTRSFSACNGTVTTSGAWGFGYLIRELSKDSGLTPETYVKDWLANWEATQPRRAATLKARVINLRRTLSGDTLNVDLFPATLTDIINRPDLAGYIGYNSVGSAGEGHFVFALPTTRRGSEYLQGDSVYCDF